MILPKATLNRFTKLVPTRLCRFGAVSLLLQFALSLPAAEIDPGPELQINEYTPGFQGSADMATDAEGNVLVVWQSEQDGDLDSIHARGLDRSGSFRGVSLLVNNFSDDIQVFPKVAADAAGNFVVVWQSFGSPGDDGSNFSIQGQVYGAAGSPAGGQFQANTFTLNGQTAPAVAAGPAGEYVIVWRSRSSDGGDSSGWSIRGRRFPAGADMQINDVTPGDQNRPAVAMAADGSFVAVWESPSSAGADTDLLSIQARRFAASGIPAGSQFQVNDWIAGAQERPSVAIAPDGSFVIAWQSGSSPGNDPLDSIQARRFDSQGQPLGPQQQINSTVIDELQSAPDVAWVGGPQPGFVIVWDSVEPPLGSVIRARRFDPTLQPLGEELLVNADVTGDQTFPAVSADDRGDFVVTWYSSTSPEDPVDAVRARRFRSTEVILDDGFEGGSAPGDRLDVVCTTNAVSSCDAPGRTLVSDPSMLTCRAILQTEAGPEDVTREAQWSADGALAGSEVFSGGTILTPGGVAGEGAIRAGYGSRNGQDILAIATQWVLDSLQLVLPDGRPVPNGTRFSTGLGYGFKLQAEYRNDGGGTCITDVTGLTGLVSDTPAVCALGMPPSPHVGFQGLGDCMLRIDYGGSAATVSIEASKEMPAAISTSPTRPGSDDPVPVGSSFEMGARIFAGLPPRNLDVSGSAEFTSSDQWVGAFGWGGTLFATPGPTLPPRFFAGDPGNTTLTGGIDGFLAQFGVNVTDDCLDAVDLWIDALPGPIETAPGDTLEAMVFGTFRSGTMRELEIGSEVSLQQTGSLLPELQSWLVPHLFTVTGLNGPTMIELVARSEPSLRCADASRPVDSVEIEVGTAQVETFTVTLDPPLGDGTLRLGQSSKAGGVVTRDDGTKRIDPPTIDWISDDPATVTVVRDQSSVEHGRFEGHAPGTASIIGELAGFSDGLSIPVVGSVLERIEIQALKTSLNPDLGCWLATDSNAYTALNNDARYFGGTDAQVRVLAYYTGVPAPRDVTDDSFFTTSDSDLAIVFNGDERGTLEVKREITGAVTLTAFFGGLQDSIVVEVENAPITAVEADLVDPVLPVVDRLIGIFFPPRPLAVKAEAGGGVQQVQAGVTAGALCYPPATFTSDDPDIAAVLPTLSSRASVDRSPRLSGHAWIHPVAAGTTNVRVQVGGLETVVPVTVVDDTVTAVRVQPTSITLSSGATHQMRAIATLSGGGETELTWSRHGTWSTTGAATSIGPWGVVFALDVAANGADTVDFCHPDGAGGTLCASTSGGAAAVAVTPP